MYVLIPAVISMYTISLVDTRARNAAAWGLLVLPTGVARVLRDVGAGTKFASDAVAVMLALEHSRVVVQFRTVVFGV